VPRISADSVSDHREQVHRRVFAAFAELMAETGYDAITMAQVAERAGLGRTAIYHHFRDKESVVVAFATHETTEYVDRLRAALAESDDPVEQMRIYVRHHLVAGERFHMGLGPSLYGRLSDEARQSIGEHVRAVEDVLREVLERGRAAGALRFDDVAATMSLIHACLSPRHLAPGATESFVLRAVGAAD